MTAAELHVHSRYGGVYIGPFPDCTTTLPDIFSACVRKNIHIIAPTDHDPSDPKRTSQELIDLAYFAGYQLLVVPSGEITARENRDIHILSYGLNKPVPPLLHLADTISALHDQGALAVAAHPLFYCGVTLQQLLDHKFDAVEIYNAAIPKFLSLLLFSIISKYSSLPTIAGSDAHIPAEIGRAVTLFPDNTVTITQVLKNIKSGNSEIRKKSSPYLRTVARMALASIHEAIT
jgi:hypothetical protein